MARSWCSISGPRGVSIVALRLPDLVAFHERYRDRGVMLIGLTDEPASQLPSIERFIRQVDGVDWPIAYGAIPAYQMTGIRGATHIRAVRSQRRVGVVGLNQSTSWKKPWWSCWRRNNCLQERVVSLSTCERAPFEH